MCKPICIFIIINWNRACDGLNYCDVYMKKDSAILVSIPLLIVIFIVISRTAELYDTDADFRHKFQKYYKPTMYKY